MFTSMLTMRVTWSSWRRRAGSGWKKHAFNWLIAQKLAFVVVNININYRRPAVLGDRLIIESEVSQLSGRSGIIAQRVLLAEDGTLVADAMLTFVCIDLRTQKAVPLEGELRERLAALMNGR